MVKRYLEDLDHLLNPQAMIRFNKTNHKLYLDIDWSEVGQNEYLIIDCYRIVDPANASKVYNDFWLKRYLTALIKKQWGMNMIKFQELLFQVEFNSTEDKFMRMVLQR